MLLANSHPYNWLFTTRYIQNPSCRWCSFNSTLEPRGRDPSCVSCVNHTTSLSYPPNTVISTCRAGQEMPIAQDSGQAAWASPNHKRDPRKFIYPTLNLTVLYYSLQRRQARRFFLSFAFSCIPSIPTTTLQREEFCQSDHTCSSQSPDQERGCHLHAALPHPDLASPPHRISSFLTPNDSFLPALEFHTNKVYTLYSF